MDSEISFARKYRPNTLEGYIGNTKIKETFRRVMASGKRPQSILLTGNTGCGKTTMARIIESWYMCEDPNEDGSPCGVCMNCINMKQYIETGNSEMLPDIKEIDVTDKSGKSDMDALLEEIEYPAYGGGWKIYMMDECHRMSSAASARMLKPLEEPPENVLIIFCTTDPQMMLETLKNRCQIKFEVSKPTTSELSTLLRDVCLDNGKEYDLQGLRMICSRADYVIRDSLNYLENVINSRGSATADAVSEEFDEVSDNLIFDFYDAYINKNYLKYMNVLYKVKTKFGFKMFLQTLVNFTTRGIYILNNISVEGLSDVEMKSYLGVFTMFSIKEISYILSSLRKMGYGDIEANFMAFIYTDISESRVVEEEKKEVKIEPSNSNNEKVFRNNNIQKLEEAKLKEGVESVKSNFQEVGFDTVEGLFKLEKVDK